MHERKGRSSDGTKVENAVEECPTALRNALSPHLLSVKRLLFVAALLMPIGGAHAAPPPIRCPGTNTVEMKYCAGKSLEKSSALLRQKITTQQYTQWSETTRTLCEAAYAPYKDGTIYPLLVAGCDDHLNRALLKEFQSLGN